MTHSSNPTHSSHSSHPSNEREVSYVATLRVEKITYPSTDEVRSSIGKPATRAPSKEKSEVTSLTIKAKSFPALQKKLQGHIALIDEDEDFS